MEHTSLIMHGPSSPMLYAPSRRHDLRHFCFLSTFDICHNCNTYYRGLSCFKLSSFTSYQGLGDGSTIVLLFIYLFASTCANKADKHISCLNKFIQHALAMVAR